MPQFKEARKNKKKTLWRLQEAEYCLLIDGKRVGSQERDGLQERVGLQDIADKDYPPVNDSESNIDSDSESTSGSSCGSGDET